tara:strand:+ start:2540 stop:3013 length:474 start_codon:yes stop_codon:yes gene_type:complete
MQFDTEQILNALHETSLEDSKTGRDTNFLLCWMKRLGQAASAQADEDRKKSWVAEVVTQPSLEDNTFFEQGVLLKDRVISTLAGDAKKEVSALVQDDKPVTIQLTVEKKRFGAVAATLRSTTSGNKTHQILGIVHPLIFPHLKGDKTSDPVGAFALK